jgi:hypothetical protein
VTNTFEKLSVGGDLPIGLVFDNLDLVLVSTDVGVPERRLLLF